MRAHWLMSGLTTVQFVVRIFAIESQRGALFGRHAHEADASRNGGVELLRKQVLPIPPSAYSAVVCRSGIQSFMIRSRAGTGLPFHLEADDSTRAAPSLDVNRARTTSRRWWERRCTRVVPMPKTVDEALLQLSLNPNLLRWPSAIHVRVAGKYPTIEGYDWHESTPAEAPNRIAEAGD